MLVAPEHAPAIPAIRAWERENPSVGIRFVEVPESGWRHLWKRHRIPWFLE